MARAKINSKQPEVPVRPANTLAGIASSHGDTLPRVEALNQDLHNPVTGFNRILPGQTVVLPKKTPSEVVAGVNNSQIKPIITALANANSADQGVADANRTHDPSGEADAEAEKTAAWNTVKHDTYTMLLDNMSPTTPDQTAQAQVKNLNELEPGNTKFDNETNGALKDRQQLNFGPIIAAYNGGHGQPTSLANAITTSLNNAANQAGSNPKARGDAITGRAALLQTFGPKDPTFQTAVRDAVGFAQPTNASATTNPGSSHLGNDPFNIIISGNSNVTLPQFLAGLEAVPDPADQRPPPGTPMLCPTPPPQVGVANPKWCYTTPGYNNQWEQVPASSGFLNPGVGPEYANVQPQGQGQSVVQPISMRVGGQSTELGSGINHFRLYEQKKLPGNNQGAYFITDSIENFNVTQLYHDVATNGYNQGRDDLLADIKTAAKIKGWTVQVAEYPTGRGTGSNGISYDGNIYVVTLTHNKSAPPISQGPDARGPPYDSSDGGRRTRGSSAPACGIGWRHVGSLSAGQGGSRCGAADRGRSGRH